MTAPRAISTAAAFALALLCCAPPGLARVPAPAQKLEGRTTGQVKNGAYASPQEDFRVRVPWLLQPGATVRDEGDANGWQVIFTDDMGAFYRVVSLNKVKLDVTLEETLVVFKDVRARTEQTTARGRELRVLDLEKEGAEIVLTISENGGPWRSHVPDLATAAAVFEHGDRIYHVIAGAPVFMKPGLEELTIDEAERRAFDLAGERLEKFLAGFELVAAPVRR